MCGLLTIVRHIEGDSTLKHTIFQIASIIAWEILKTASSLGEYQSCIIPWKKLKVASSIGIKKFIIPWRILKVALPLGEY